MSNANGVSQLLLASGNLDCSLNGPHGDDISSAYVLSQQQRCLDAPTIAISIANMSDKKPVQRRELTPKERDAAASLKKRFKAYTIRTGESQTQIGGKFGGGESGITQSAISQYLNGKIPLNAKAALWFASVLGCEPSEVIDLPELRGVMAPVTPDPEPEWPFEMFSRKQFKNLSPKHQGIVDDRIAMLIEKFEGEPQMVEHTRETRRKKNTG